MVESQAHLILSDLSRNPPPYPRQKTTNHLPHWQLNQPPFPSISPETLSDITCCHAPHQSMFCECASRSMLCPRFWKFDHKCAEILSSIATPNSTNWSSTSVQSPSNQTYFVCSRTKSSNTRYSGYGSSGLSNSEPVLLCKIY